ncbi:MAG: hypothetical protein ABMB14_20055 [Myxococcota bacterium]
MIVGWATAAYGAACCGTGPPIDPGALAQDEVVGIGVGLSATGTPTRWDTAGQLHATDGAEVGTAVSARVRPTRWLPVGVVVPAAVALSADGIAPTWSDPVALARLEPPSAVLGRLHPVLTGGIAAPLEVADDRPPWWRGIVAPSVELATDTAAASGWVSASVPVWGAADDGIHPGTVWELAAAGGPRGEWGSVAVGGGARLTTPGRLDGRRVGVGSAAPILRGSATIPVVDHLRVVLVAEGGPPVPLLGRNADLSVAIAGSVIRTW